MPQGRGRFGTPLIKPSAVGMTEPHEPKKSVKSRPAKGDRAFDEWLNRGLHDLYDEVVREPVPPELMKLIEDDRRK